MNKLRRNEHGDILLHGHEFKEFVQVVVHSRRGAVRQAAQMMAVGEAPVVLLPVALLGLQEKVVGGDVGLPVSLFLQSAEHIVAVAGLEVLRPVEFNQKVQRPVKVLKMSAPVSAQSRAAQAFIKLEVGDGEMKLEFVQRLETLPFEQRHFGPVRSDGHCSVLFCFWGLFFLLRFKQTLAMHSLTIIAGPMFSSKSTTLLAELRKHHKVLKKKVCALGNSVDTRSGPRIRSHDGDSWPSLVVQQLSEIFQSPHYDEIEVYFIDEAQFFEDLEESVDRLLRDGKKVFVSGLLGDRFQKPIGQLCQLLPKADEIIFLKAYCAKCRDGTEAPFTRYIGKAENSNQILVGGTESYIPVCRKHFEK